MAINLLIDTDVLIDYLREQGDNVIVPYHKVKGTLKNTVFANSGLE